MAKRAATVLGYGRRIERVVAHIAANLDAPELDLAELAAVACLSPHHFHRVYRSVTGETAADTLRRLRLHRAAAELVNGGEGDEPVAAIARRAGYGSAAALTRAFAAAYGVPPAAYRRRGRPTTGGTNAMHHDSGDGEVTIRHLEPVRLAALRHVGPYTEIGPTFQRLYAWAAPRGLLRPGTRFLAVYHDDPTAVPAQRLRSDACLSVGPEVGPEGDVAIVEVPGGRHAVLVHRGPYAEIEGAYRRLFGAWLPASGEEPADRPCFDEYLNDPRSTPPSDLLTAICLPLAERRAEPAATVPT
jgi:AraC family transcriptional regulator